MIKKTSYILRVIVLVILLFSLTHLSIMNSGKTIARAASTADQESASTPYIFNPFYTPDWIGESDLGGTAYGASVASAGDVNGDGYADVIVGTPHYSNGQNIEGRAYLYYGSKSGVKPLPAWTFESNIAECELGWSVASAGDVNGDGFDDVLVGSEFLQHQH